MNGPAKILVCTYDSHLIDEVDVAVRPHRRVLHAANLGEARVFMRDNPDVQVVISDLLLPDGSGIQILREARSERPFSARVLVVRSTEGLGEVARALREGGICRLITTPIEGEAVREAVIEGVALYEATVEAERQTEAMRLGVIRAFQQVLCAASPEVCSRASKIALLSMALGKVLLGEAPWEMQAAAMFQELGMVALGQHYAHSLLAGQSLREKHKQLVQMIPRQSANILRAIPHLRGVAEVIDQTDDRYEGERRLEAEVLLVCSAVITMETHAYPREQIIAYLKGKRKRYSTRVVDALPRAFELLAKVTTEVISVVNAVEGQVLADDLHSRDGVLLLPRGTTLVEGTILRLRGFSREKGDPLALRVYTGAGLLGPICGMRAGGKTEEQE